MTPAGLTHPAELLPPPLEPCSLSKVLKRSVCFRTSSLLYADDELALLMMRGRESLTKSQL